MLSFTLQAEDYTFHITAQATPPNTPQPRYASHNNNIDDLRIDRRAAIYWDICTVLDRQCNNVRGYWATSRHNEWMKTARGRATPNRGRFKGHLASATQIKCTVDTERTFKYQQKARYRSQQTDEWSLSSVSHVKCRCLPDDKSIEYVIITKYRYTRRGIEYQRRRIVEIFQ